MIIFKILFSQKHCTLYWSRLDIYEFEICVSLLLKITINCTQITSATNIHIHSVTCDKFAPEIIKMSTLLHLKPKSVKNSIVASNSLQPVSECLILHTQPYQKESASPMNGDSNMIISVNIVNFCLIFGYTSIANNNQITQNHSMLNLAASPKIHDIIKKLFLQSASQMNILGLS